MASKKRIPKAVKTKTWDRCIGKNNAIGKCYCCNDEIHILEFHCGHIVAEAKGGSMALDNLKPICASCNASIGTRNMEDFIKIYNMRNSKKSNKIEKVADDEISFDDYAMKMLKYLKKRRAPPSDLSNSKKEKRLSLWYKKIRKQKLKNKEQNVLVQINRQIKEIEIERRETIIVKILASGYYRVNEIVENIPQESISIFPRGIANSVRRHCEKMVEQNRLVKYPDDRTYCYGIC